MFFSSGIDVNAFYTSSVFRNIFVMLAMLVIATALVSSSVNTRASNEEQFDYEHNSALFHEDDMTPEFTEQLSSADRTSGVSPRNVVNADKYEQQQTEVKTPKIPAAAEKPLKDALVHYVSKHDIAPRHVQVLNASNVNNKKTRNVVHEETDIVDREDHVTQYLSDQMVNTDSEITSLQASETEEEREESANSELKQDAFFAFLTGLEKALEVDGVWSRPNDVGDQAKIPTGIDKQVNPINNSEDTFENTNAITAVKYKD